MAEIKKRNRIETKKFYSKNQHHLHKILGASATGDVEVEKALTALFARDNLFNMNSEEVQEEIQIMNNR